jgi:CRP-like cAMP-binding protein
MQAPEQLIKAIFDEVYPVSPRSLGLITDLLSYSAVAQGEVFIPRGRANASEYFVLEGICRSYLLNPDGEEVTISFFQGPAVLSPHITRTAKGLSQLHFQAITELEIAAFSAEGLLELMIQHLDIRFFANTVLRNELIRKVNKEIGLASYTAKERLLQFRETHDGLENLVPHAMIASYLGITTVTLSRLRRELAREA